MYIALIAWLYVTLMMAVAEASGPTGSVLGALVTFVLYGLLPIGILGYILGTPARKRALHARAQEEAAAAGADRVQDSALPSSPVEPDADSHPARAAEANGIAAVRKEP